MKFLRISGAIRAALKAGVCGWASTKKWLKKFIEILANIQPFSWNFVSVSMRVKNLILALAVYCTVGGLVACNGIDTGRQGLNKGKNIAMDYKVNKTEAEWLAQLGESAFEVLRKKGTERPFSSEYETFWDSGIYVCKGCGEELFSSATKFDAGCGWPSFYQSIDKSKVKEILDNSHGMRRVEVVCSNCGGHLGHVFNDGYNQPTGLRYCINGVSLGFIKKQ